MKVYVRKNGEDKQVVVNKALARRVLKAVDAGLVYGIGVPEPGHMCVEAAVCYALGQDHDDQPACVDGYLRTFKINLNDVYWSSPAARAKGMRRLAIAQLGTHAISFSSQEFARHLAIDVGLRMLFVRLLDDEVMRVGVNKERGEALIAAIQREPFDIHAVSDAWRKVQIIHGSAGPAGTLLDCLSSNCCRPASAIHATHRMLLCVLEGVDVVFETDRILAEYAEAAVQILIKMKTPGSKWLDLTE